MKKAVLLINLGSPDAPTIKSVWKYLRQFLMDGRVIDIPYFIRLILVNLIIIPKRVSNSTKEYKKMWVKYGNSPLIENTKKLTIINKFFTLNTNLLKKGYQMLQESYCHHNHNLE